LIEKQRSSESDEKLSEKRKRKLGLKKKKRKRKAIETQGSLSCFFFFFLRKHVCWQKKRVTYQFSQSKTSSFLAQTKPDGKKESSSQSRALNSI
jgi:hypothetical protein